MTQADDHVVCIGAGPAGLTAAYRLSRRGVPVTVLEQDPTYVGGIARTVSYRGFHFDIGGHRFFSKSRQIEDLWTEILGEDLLSCRRRSRIFYRRALFSYPLRADDVLRKLGVVESMLCIGSYLRARARPVAAPDNFEDWVVNKFGRRLFHAFFQTYTEKVWGMSCREISADWAAQRINGLSLGKAAWRAVFPQRESKNRDILVKTLIDRFRYPRRGPGMMWERAAERISEAGGRVRLGRRVVAVERAGPRWRVTAENAAGDREHLDAAHVLSTMPVRDLFACISPAPPAAAARAAAALVHRDFLLVALVLRDRGTLDDHWIYIHEPAVRVGRIQNFKTWSPEMVPEPGLTCYGLEYFCFEGDGLWTSEDSALLELARDELVGLGLAAREDIVDGHVVRQPKAYPVYDRHYQQHVHAVREAVTAHFPGLHLAGRNGMHKYDNQDHAMMTALLCAENILAGRRLYDPWQVNQDAEYLEAGAGTGRRGPGTPGRDVPRPR